MAEPPQLPSGHTIVALSFTAAALLVASDRARPIVTLVGAGYSALIGTSLPLTANHRLGDVLGSCLLMTFILALAEPRVRPALRRSKQVASATMTLRLSAAMFASGALVCPVMRFAPVARGVPIVALDPLLIFVTECLIFASAVATTVGRLLRLTAT